MVLVIFVAFVPEREAVARLSEQRAGLARD